MKISELIAQLEALKDIYGDRDIYMEYDDIAKDIYAVEIDTLPIGRESECSKVTGIIIK